MEEKVRKMRNKRRHRPNKRNKDVRGTQRQEQKEGKEETQNKAGEREGRKGQKKRELRGRGMIIMQQLTLNIRYHPYSVCLFVFFVCLRKQSPFALCPFITVIITIIITITIFHTLSPRIITEPTILITIIFSHIAYYCCYHYHYFLPSILTDCYFFNLS